MSVDKKRKDFEKSEVDEEMILNIMSGNQASDIPEVKQQQQQQQQQQKKKNDIKEKVRINSSKSRNYEEIFLVNRFPSGRSGKVVYIRPEYHERLLRIVQLTREDKTTLYSYIDNILEQHFKEYGDEITAYFNDHFKPIL